MNQFKTLICLLLLNLSICCAFADGIDAKPEQTAISEHADDARLEALEAEQVNESFYVNLNVAALKQSAIGQLIFEKAELQESIDEGIMELGFDFYTPLEAISVFHTSGENSFPTMIFYGDSDADIEHMFEEFLRENSPNVRQFSYRDRDYLVTSRDAEAIEDHRTALTGLKRSNPEDIERWYDEQLIPQQRVIGVAWGDRQLMISGNFRLLHQFIDTGIQPDSNWRVRNQGLAVFRFDRDRVIADMNQLFDIEPGQLNFPMMNHLKSVTLSGNEQFDRIHIQADLEAADAVSADLIHNLVQTAITFAMFETDSHAIAQDLLSHMSLSQQGNNLMIDFDPDVLLIRELIEEEQNRYE